MPDRDRAWRAQSAYVSTDSGPPRFRRVMAPGRAELELLLQRISQRVGRRLERMGLLIRDAEAGYVDLAPPEDHDPIPHLLGSSLS